MDMLGINDISSLIQLQKLINVKNMDIKYQLTNPLATEKTLRVFSAGRVEGAHSLKSQISYSS